MKPCLARILCLSVWAGSAWAKSPTLPGQPSLPVIREGPSIELLTAPAPMPVTVDVPELTIVGTPETRDVVIEVPDFSIVGKPDRIELVVDVPGMVIIGRPDRVALDVVVPELTIVGRPEKVDVVVDVPDLVIVGRTECEDETVAVNLECETPDRELTGAKPSTQPVTLLAFPEPPDTNKDDDKASTKTWCTGAYTAHFSQGLATAQGVAMPVGQFTTVPAYIEVENCGAQMTATIGGIPVPMAFDDGSQTYSGVLSGMGDGVNRRLVLACDKDFQMRGQLVAQDPNLRIARAAWLIRKEAPEEITCN